ncbi:MAG: LTA synthase family protein [Bacteroidota bacterium]
MIFNKSIHIFKNKSYSPAQIACKAYLFFILLFIVGRALFIFHHFSLVHQESYSTFFDCYKIAFLLDLSACSFLFILPLLILLVGFYTTFNPFYKIFRTVLAGTAFLLIILQSIDIVLYEDWQCKLNYKAFSYLSNPSEIIETASTHHYISFFLLLFVQFCFLYYFFQKWFHKNITIHNKSPLYRFLFFVLSIGLSILAYRGGIKPIPINTSDTYFSKNQAMNDAATNTIWYVAQSFYENYAVLKNKPFQFYTAYEAKKTVADMYSYPKDSTTSILKSTKPNIVIVLLESFSADVMWSYNGHNNCTPNLDKLSKEGVSFTQCYAPGWRSDLGMASILSSVSCEPYRAITPQVSKYHGLSSFTQTLKKNKYTTSFLYGGQLRYANLKSYIYWNQFDLIKEGADMNIDQPNGKLGVHDEALFKEAIADLNKMKTPFCSFIYTLSSHPPYDMPMKTVFTNGGVENQYINSVYYTDKCIGDFMNACKKQSWYDSTLFVFIADHGHGTPTYKQWDIESHRIPFILYGNVIQDQFKGYKNDKIISQTDLSATILAQLKINYTGFEFSKDAMNPFCPQFAPFVKNNGYGLLTDKGVYIYDLITNKPQHFHTVQLEDQAVLEQQSKSYIQRTFDFFDGL